MRNDCFFGNLNKIKWHIQKQPNLLDRRITPTRDGCLTYVIFGYAASRKPEHVLCIKYLVDKGVPINGKNALGNTPLHTFISACWLRAEIKGWEGQHEEIAQFLLDRGADINLKNRSGDSPLSTAIDGANALSHDDSNTGSKCIQWLLDHGADLGATDNDGAVVYDFAMLTENADLVSDHMTSICRKMRDEALEKGVIRRCKICGKAALKKCSGCYLVYYCGRECQMMSWNHFDHKKKCKDFLEGYKMFRLQPDAFSYRLTIPGSGQVVNWHPMVFHEPRGKKNFVVKIQAPWKAERERESGLNKDMLVHNEGKTIFGMISPEMDHYQELLQNIRGKGVLGVRAYFYAFWESGATKAESGIKINIKEVQPPEVW